MEMQAFRQDVRGKESCEFTRGDAALRSLELQLFSSGGRGRSW